MHIFLLGFMGTGKSTVGKALALRLGVSFYDTDCIIEEKSGKSIARIFKDGGEPVFRALESQVLQELIKKPAAVISAGGGVLLANANRVLIEKSGTPILLCASLPVLEKRLEQETQKRPLLSQANWKEQLKDLYEARASVYRRIQNQVDTDKKTIEEIVWEILKIMKPNAAASRSPSPAF